MSCYVFWRLNTINSIERISLLSFFTLEESVTAKQILIASCEKIINPELINDFKKRRLNTKGDAKHKVIKDILDIWAVVDCEKAGNLQTQFVAANVSRLPSVNADQFNLQFLVSSILKLQEQYNENKLSLSLVHQDVKNIKQHLDTPHPHSGLSSASLNATFSPAYQTPSLRSPRRLLPL